MRIAVHDYSGHPFQVQLSRELARRGHTVQHSYCSSYSTGKGKLDTQHGDPASLSIVGMAMASEFARYSPAKRIFQEVSYGLSLAKHLKNFDPEVAILCNVPLLAHGVAAECCARAGLRMVFWHQDVYSNAIGAEARRRLRVVGPLVARVAERVERRVARRSARIVAISESFLPVLHRWGVDRRATVIPNWADASDVKPLSKQNGWAAAHDLSDRPVLLYSGTLGLKHDPAFLADLATTLGTELPAARVVVVSQGRGRQWLEEWHRDHHEVDTLLLLDYQPYVLLPEVLASADILLALLEPDASAYSVPSKVLTYLCAGRPVAALIPAENAAARTISSSGAGVVMAPGDRARAIREVLDLLSDEGRRSAAADAAREYAERTFDIRDIADRFERVLSIAVDGGSHRGGLPTSAGIGSLVLGTPGSGKSST
jgi:colanic acid biosynthesis glycosyl transferase WcaI